MLSMILNEVVPPPPPPPPPPLPSSGAPSTTTTTTMAPAPRFPIYLLPSLSRPFRRHRRLLSPGNVPPARSAISSLNDPPTDSVVSGPPPPVAEGPPASSSSSRLPSSRLSREAVKDGRPRLARIQPDTIRCSACGTDLAFYSQIVSKMFTGRYGRAYLVSPPSPTAAGAANDHPSRRPGAANNLTNVRVGKPENRVLVTGAHVVSDIQCATCRARVGWKYVDAKEESQKYKIGKFILETQRTVSYRNWDDAVAAEDEDDDEPELELEFEFGRDDSREGSDAEPVAFDSDDSDDCEDLFAGVWDAKSAAKRRKLKRNQRWK